MWSPPVSKKIIGPEGQVTALVLYLGKIESGKLSKMVASTAKLLFFTLADNN